MDIKTISATLALLAGGVTLGACDDDKKPATEVDAAKKGEAKPAADKEKGEDDKANAKADKEDKGEMACGEGACGGEGGCGGKKHDKADGDEKTVHADGEEGEKAEGDKAEGEKAEGEKAEGEDEDKT
jgi:hypothetical protein